MKRKILMVHEDQDRSLENRDQRGMNTVSKKGILRSIWRQEKLRRGRGRDEDKDKSEMRIRARQGQGLDEDQG